MAGTEQKFGFKMLVERLRWEGKVRKLPEEDYCLNNSHVAHIGREIVRRNPDVAQWIEFRRAG